MTPAERLLNKFRSDLLELGVEDFIICLNDPDSDSNTWRINGSNYWIIGACRVIEKHIEKECLGNDDE